MPYSVSVNHRGQAWLRTGMAGATRMSVRSIGGRFSSTDEAHAAADEHGLEPRHYTIKHVPTPDPLLCEAKDISSRSGGVLGPDGAQPVSTGRTDDAPPSNTGGKSISPVNAREHAVCVDWMRLSGSDTKAQDAINILSIYFGEGAYGKGKYFMSTGYRWGNGAGVYWNETTCIVEVTGSFCAELQNDDVRAILEAMYANGFHATRIDVAIDLLGEDIDLIPRLIDSCRDSALVGARRYEIYEGHTADRVTRDGISIGRRGSDGSGRYVRVYDKGLQTDSDEHRSWVRYEAEFAQDVANQVADHLITARHFETSAAQLALGCFSLKSRPRNEFERTHTKERSDVSWWVQFVSSIVDDTTRVVARREPTQLVTHVLWVRTALAAVKGMAKAANVEEQALFDWYSTQLDPHLSDNAAVVLHQLVAELPPDIQRTEPS